jgi:ribosomal protein L7Ae-like RNA K-turn-binding protein
MMLSLRNWRVLMNRRAASLLSLARRAGKLVMGEDSVLNSIRSGEALVVIIPEDAAENTKKKFRDKCSYYNINIILTATKTEINECIGEYNRSCFAIKDEGFAKGIIEALGE